MIVCVVNVKGGVGKTTTATNLCATFAGTGLRTLLVDLDPQASATRSVGGASGELSVADVLLRGATVRDAAAPTTVEDLSLLAGSMELAAADLKLARKKGATDRLRASLARIRAYDVVMIDCPPGLSLLTLMGLEAAQGMIVPVNPQGLAVAALGRFFEALEELDELSREPELLGVLLTMVDRRTKVTEQMVEQVRKSYGRKVFTTEVPLNIRLAVAASEGRTILDFERWSTGAVAYRKLGGEVLRRARRRDLL